MVSSQPICLQILLTGTCRLRGSGSAVVRIIIFHSIINIMTGVYKSSFNYFLNIIIINIIIKNYYYYYY